MALWSKKSNRYTLYFRLYTKKTLVKKAKIQKKKDE